MPSVNDERRFARPPMPECTLVLGPEERDAIKEMGCQPLTTGRLLDFLGPRWELKKPDEDVSRIIALYASGQILGYGRIQYNAEQRPNHVEIEYSLHEQRVLDFTLSKSGLVETVHDQRTMVHPFEQSVAIVSSTVQLYRRPRTLNPVEMYVELLVREQHPQHKHAVFLSSREDRFMLE
jgi:hypothetical protein